LSILDILANHVSRLSRYVISAASVFADFFGSRPGFRVHSQGGSQNVRLAPLLQFGQAMERLGGFIIDCDGYGRHALSPRAISTSES